MMAPSLHAASRDPNSAPVVADCGKCMKQLPRLQRQTLGCGYEPPTTLPVQLWDREGRKAYPDEHDEHGKPHERVCAGYLVHLPIVAETFRAYSHWDKGQLATFCGGQPPEQMIQAVELLDYAVNELRAHETAKAAKGS